MKFRYARLRYTPQPGQQFSILRPIIPIGLRYQNRTFPGLYSALLDSGADNCIFHAEVGEELGIDVRSGEGKVFSGMGFGKTTGYSHLVDISVGGLWVPRCLVSFSYGLSRDSVTYPGQKEGFHYGILGQEGFFDKFKVTFDREAEDIELRPKKSATS